MALPLPQSLSPSKMSRFTECALAFRFSAIDRLPELPSLPAVKGTLVHGALERLFWDHPRGERTGAAAIQALSEAREALGADPEWQALGLSGDAETEFVADAQALVDGYLRLEDPDTVDAVGVELLLETELEGVTLRGIIDRLDVTSTGGLVVVDYKTGRAPSEMQERARLAGVHFYAFLCEEVLGVRPSAVRLMYLRQPLVLETVPSDQAIRGLKQRTAAVWKAIERSCADEDFRPKPGPLCHWCSFRSFCPAFGGEMPAAETTLALSAAAG